MFSRVDINLMAGTPTAHRRDRDAAVDERPCQEVSEVVQADMVDMVEVEVGPLATETVGAHVTPVVAQQQRRFPRLLRVGGRRRS